MAGRKVYSFNSSEAAAISFLLAGIEAPADFTQAFAQTQTFSALTELLSALQANGGENYLKIHAAISEKRTSMLGSESEFRKAILTVLSGFLPDFLYFDEYSSLKGSIKVRELLAKPKDQLSEEEKTARALLTLAGTDDQYLLNPDY